MKKFIFSCFFKIIQSKYHTGSITFKGPLCKVNRKKLQTLPVFKVTWVGKENDFPLNHLASVTSFSSRLIFDEELTRSTDNVFTNGFVSKST